MFPSFKYLASCTDFFLNFELQKSKYLLCTCRNLKHFFFFYVTFSAILLVERQHSENQKHVRFSSSKTNQSGNHKCKCVFTVSRRISRRCLVISSYRERTTPAFVGARSSPPPGRFALQMACSSRCGPHLHILFLLLRDARNILGIVRRLADGYRAFGRKSIFTPLLPPFGPAPPSTRPPRALPGPHTIFLRARIVIAQQEIFVIIITYRSRILYCQQKTETNEA